MEKMTFEEAMQMLKDDWYVNHEEVEPEALTCKVWVASYEGSGGRRGRENVIQIIRETKSEAIKECGKLARQIEKRVVDLMTAMEKQGDRGVNIDGCWYRVEQMALRECI